MKQSDNRMRLIVKDPNLQHRIQRVISDQEITHEQLLKRYLKLPEEGDLTGLNEKYGTFVKFLKKHIIKSKDVNKMDLLMGHIWVIIANTIKGVYDSNKVSDTILTNIDNGNWSKEMDTGAAWLKVNGIEIEEDD